MHTRFTEKLQIKHPIILAPMAGVSGGKLAASVVNAGGFGLVAGGYGYPEFLEKEYTLALESLDNPTDLSYLGVGFITWKLTEHHTTLTKILEHPQKPATIFLGFGDPAPYVEEIKAAGCALWCQTSNMKQLKHAADLGADVIIAQGTGGGGHSAVGQESRSTMTFVPEAADWLHTHHPDILLGAAGGINDARTLLAALALGADAVVMGTSFWLAEESLASTAAKEYSVKADGDATIQSAVLDILRGHVWPPEYAIRSLKSNLIELWTENLTGLFSALPMVQHEYLLSVSSDLPDNMSIVGEGIGLHNRNLPAAALIEEITSGVHAQARLLNDLLN